MPQRYGTGWPQVTVSLRWLSRARNKGWVRRRRWTPRSHRLESGSRRSVNVRSAEFDARPIGSQESDLVGGTFRCLGTQHVLKRVPCDGAPFVVEILIFVGILVVECIVKV